MKKLSATRVNEEMRKNENQFPFHFQFNLRESIQFHYVGLFALHTNNYNWNSKRVYKIYLYLVHSFSLIRFLNFQSPPAHINLEEKFMFMTNPHYWVVIYMTRFDSLQGHSTSNSTESDFVTLSPEVSFEKLSYSTFIRYMVTLSKTNWRFNSRNKF